MLYYLDTSALVKRYARETGSTWMLSLCTPSPSHIIAVSLITKAELAKRNALRGYDAIQLACALTLNTSLTTLNLPPLTFLSADARLLQAATREGLTTDNPNQHP